MGAPVSPSAGVTGAPGHVLNMGLLSGAVATTVAK